MIFWNDLQGSTSFNKIYSSPIPIGEIELFSLGIDNNTPTITFEFDIAEYADMPSQKWKQSGLNTCQLGLNCSFPKKLKISTIPTKYKLQLRITQQYDSFIIHASNNESLIELKTKDLFTARPFRL
ncbi:Imm50 family immunity protein [Pseudomonas sp. SWRI154]|uniref:Imm50 family immunity protein n=1 Tax=Pseudomonas sp. SWRI154 TaxID=2745501 RepID=UPI001648226B|nr:Imm50 family immunity protein [Pseudomonas sp. SWRI154]MBC3364825.1 hypothetical protein [Pseudomonas sp. SWRI154]